MLMVEKRYYKGALRERLQENMKQEVTKVEFAKWIRWYCECKNKPTELIQQKTLTASQVAELEEWLGYSMR